MKKVITKYCKKCDRNRTLNNFSKNKHTVDGLQFYCKDCSKELCSSFREDNPVYWKEWNIKNPDYRKSIYFNLKNKGTKKKETILEDLLQLKKELNSGCLSDVGYVNKLESLIINI